MKEVNYKKDDCVADEDGFNAFLVKRLKDGYCDVLIPMGKYYKDVWHEDDFSLYEEDEDNTLYCDNCAKEKHQYQLHDRDDEQICDSCCEYDERYANESI